MSGQPYRYYTDPTKYRTMFMDTLDLQANINAMNLEANKTYKETGQLPAVSQMKETRTTSEILADTLKLKIDVTQSIAKVSSQQFGQLVVQRIESHPLNIDNRLLIFAAQRIDDIIDNLRKIYKYGIKGDNNDAEQLVSFISKMYNDKNSITAQTKAFMDSQGLRSMSQSSNVFLNLYQYLTRLSVKIVAMNKELNNMESNADYYDTESLIEPFRASARITAELGSILKTIMGVLPNTQTMTTAMETMVLMYAESTEVRRNPTATTRGQLSGIQSVWADSDEEDTKILNEKLFDELTEYLDYVNTSLPSIGIMTSLESQLDTYFKQLSNSYNINLLPYYKNSNNLIIPSGIEKAILINIEKFVDICNRLYGVLLPSPEWTEYKIKKLNNNLDNIIEAWNRIKGQPTPSLQPDENATLRTENANSIPSETTEESVPLPTKKYSTELEETLRELYLLQKASPQNLNTDRIDEILYQLDNEFTLNLSLPEGSDIKDYITNINHAREFLKKEIADAKARGEGLHKRRGVSDGLPKRRGRPKGSGISKAKTYKEIVKAHSALDKGINETPRFVKFGKFLVNTHRLNNEDIFALKRPSGGNIVEIPSIKISKNLSSVIKKMIGGEIPTYSDISKLSEPEKAYLHKVSKKSNILDKFDIPAPSKDALERDIHQFEVMKGEILAGNDNKELIRKFKAHILKLSKNGTLPKREVQEILEDLLELNI